MALNGDLNTPIENMVKGITKAKEEVASELLELVKMRTPIRTGLLQNSWTSEITDTEIILGNEVPYCEYQEYGTPTTPPIGMLAATMLDAPIIVAKALIRNV